MHYINLPDFKIQFYVFIAHTPTEYVCKLKGRGAGGGGGGGGAIAYIAVKIHQYFDSS